MGLFSGIKNTYKKSEAAVVVQNLLEIQANAGMLNLDPQKLATLLIDAAWEEKPAVFNGHFGQRPFKISVAAIAIAKGITAFENDQVTSIALTISLGNIFSEIEVNGRLYPLNSIDHELLESAMAVYLKATEEITNTPLGNEISAIVDADELDTTNDLSFESYRDQYMEEVKRLDPDSLVKGLHWLELTDDEGTRRAYEDGVEPKKLAEIVLRDTNITDIKM